MGNDLVPSLIRTYVPIIVGTIAAFLTAHSMTLDPSSIAGLTAFLSGLFNALYYLVARVLESRYPRLGWLLGSPKQPIY